MMGYGYCIYDCFQGDKLSQHHLSIPVRARVIKSLRLFFLAPRKKVARLKYPVPTPQTQLIFARCGFNADFSARPARVKIHGQGEQQQRSNLTGRFSFFF
jgi:hypothetical protein